MEERFLMSEEPLDLNCWYLNTSSKPCSLSEVVTPREAAPFMFLRVPDRVPVVSYRGTSLIRERPTP